MGYYEPDETFYRYAERVRREVKEVEESQELEMKDVTPNPIKITE